jgi:hypothetical protein
MLRGEALIHHRNDYIKRTIIARGNQWRLEAKHRQYSKPNHDSSPQLLLIRGTRDAASINSLVSIDHKTITTDCVTSTAFIFPSLFSSFWYVTCIARSSHEAG